MSLKPEQVAAAIKSGANQKISDGRSLYLVTRNGKGFWVFEYRDGSARRSRGLGSAADVSPAAARRARDTFAVNRTRASLHSIAAMPHATPGVAAGKPFGRAFAEYLKNHASDWGDRQRRQYAALATNHCGPLDDLPVDAITTQQLADVLQPIWRGPSTGQGARLRGLMEH